VSVCPPFCLPCLQCRRSKSSNEGHTSLIRKLSYAVIYNCTEILPRKGSGAVGSERGFEKGALCASGETDFDPSYITLAGTEHCIIVVDFFISGYFPAIRAYIIGYSDSESKDLSRARGVTMSSNP
jgi:hypothetical protein